MNRPANPVLVLFLGGSTGVMAQTADAVPNAVHSWELLSGEANVIAMEVKSAR
ncbi:MAG: hypothetical protein ACT4PM_10275 [Gemmatimonadales bacterium]